MQDGNWIDMNYAVQLSVFKKKKYLNFLRILMPVMHVQATIYVLIDLLFEELGFNFLFQMM